MIAKLRMIWPAALWFCLLGLSSCAPGKPSRGDGAIASQLSNFDVIAFGEIHGTTESARAFKSVLLSYLATSHSPVLVAVEIPSDALDDAKRASQSCSSGSSCKLALSNSPFWKLSRDGRSSEACYELIGSLTELEQKGAIRLVSADYRVTGREPFGAIAAAHLLPLVRNTNGKLFTFTGNAHSTLDDSENSLAGALNKEGERVLSVSLLNDGGEAWVCSGGVCGMTPIPSNSHCDAKQGALQLSGNPVSASMCIGKLTVSPPAVE